MIPHSLLPEPLDSKITLVLNCSKLIHTATQIRTLTGGTVTAVPEPLTMLGASTAVAIGAAFKRRRKQSAQ